MKETGMTYGIQGGKGSFNEKALDYYTQREGINKFKVKYLYTTLNVMEALRLDQIDRGQFAICNSTGGMVEESVQAIANYKFKVEAGFAIKIAHALMVRGDAKISDVTTIMTHPQVLAQCKNNLVKKSLEPPASSFIKSPILPK